MKRLADLWLLREQRQGAFEALFEALPEAALRLEPSGRVRGANPALRRALGPTYPVRAGTSPEALFQPESRSPLTEWLARGGAAPVELRLIAPEGAPGLPVAPLRLGLPDGGAVLLLQDLAQRQLMAAKVAEAERLQTLGTLAGGIAHDFNNILAIILGAAEGAERLSGPAAAAELAQIREAAERGGGLVRQLLAYARQQVLAPRLVPLNQAISGMARLLTPLLGPDIRLELALEEPERTVRIDPSELDRVVMNLAMNARQAMPRGGRLRLATGRQLLLQALPAMPEPVPAGRWTVLEVSDSGQGIPSEILPRIFEPFFTSRAQQGGTGMGLATVHGIVRQSGGYLTVSTRPGEGTCFRILLPRVEEAAPEAVSQAVANGAAEGPAPSPLMAQSGTAAPLLLVEDEALLRQLAERSLRRAGWEVVAAEDAEAALDLVEAGLAPRALVSDVIMPGMDGLALCGRLRHRFPALPVLLTSGYAPSMVETGVEGEGLRFLAKPYAPAQLVEAVKALLPR